jgi:hypothetical protein
MAHDDRDDQWGDTTARVTFLWTAIGAALFLGAMLAVIR